MQYFGIEKSVRPILLAKVVIMFLVITIHQTNQLWREFWSELCKNVLKEGKLAVDILGVGGLPTLEDLDTAYYHSCVQIFKSRQSTYPK